MGDILKKRIKQQKFKNTEQEAIINLIVTSNYLHSKLDSICSGFNITHSQFNVLRILKGVYPEGHPRGEIKKRMLEPSPDVTRLIDKLVTDGLVERFGSSEDRRLSMARITEKGIDLLEKINPEIDRFLINYSSPLAEAEKIILSNLCEKLYAREIKD
jgi:DNA-binding MarR family transcriptional regulator